MKILNQILIVSELLKMNAIGLFRIHVKPMWIVIIPDAWNSVKDNMLLHGDESIQWL